MIDTVESYSLLKSELSKFRFFLRLSFRRVCKAPFTLLRFCTKTERKTSVFVKVFTLIRTKMEVFENAVKIGYPQKRKFLKTHWINVNTQKQRFLKTLQQQQQNYNDMKFFPPFFVQKRSNVNK